MTNGPSLVGSPSSTASFAPDGIDPGPSFYLMSAGIYTLSSIGSFFSSAADVATSETAKIVSTEVTPRNLLYIVVLLQQTVRQQPDSVKPELSPQFVARQDRKRSAVLLIRTCKVISCAYEGPPRDWTPRIDRRFVRRAAGLCGDPER